MTKVKEKDVEAIVQRMLDEQQKRSKEIDLGKKEEVCHNREMDLLKIQNAIKDMQKELNEVIEQATNVQAIVAKTTEACAKIDFSLKMISREIENNNEEDE